MLGKVLFLSACFFTIALAVDVSTGRPKTCAVGTTYKKDCNTCTCAANVKDDKCGQVDCSRTPSTAEPSNGKRPGDCPTVVPEPEGSGICAKRTKESECVKDNDCGQAKKCCIDGCKKYLCRAAIYNYGKNT